ncbi:MAG: asparaginase [Flavobacteriales bacterium]
MKKILIIYTGGTIGMVKDENTGNLKPFDFKHILKHVPELEKFNIELEVVPFSPPIDSSAIKPEDWVKIVEIIEENYERTDGFVILHGTDTMAYTASALSFMMKGLKKSVILTGSQLPIGMIRTDGKENIITAIELASSEKNGVPRIPEIGIYFDNRLYRGNRTHKFSAEHFNAFISSNYPQLASVGVDIKFHEDFIKKEEKGAFQISKKLDSNIASIKLFPGIQYKNIEPIIMNPDIKGIILETFGTGNSIKEKWLFELIESAVKEGKLILNVTQCNSGPSRQGMYEISDQLEKCGVINGYDITFEAALTKMMYLFGQYESREEIKEKLRISLKGEMTVIA